MKNFEKLMRDNGLDSESPEEAWVRRLEEGEEEVTDEEIEARIDVFMRTVEAMDKKQKDFLTKLSLKLNNLVKANCNPGQLLQAFNLETKEVLER